MTLMLTQLSCQQCQRRKTRCDKKIPCSACVKANVTCTAVRRQRLPRGRSGNQQSGSDRDALNERVARLEALVSSLQPNTSISALSEVASSPDELDRSSRATPLQLESLVAPAFWTELTDAVAGLRDVLESSEEVSVADDEVHTQVTQAESHPSPFVRPHSLLFGYGQANGDPDRPSSESRKYLHNIYHERVDVIFKVVHWPSARAALQQSEIEHDSASASPEVKALEAAICFTALCSLHDHEIERRRELLQTYRWMAESALAEANLLTTSSLETLQAFVVYLVSSPFFFEFRSSQLLHTSLNLADEIAKAGLRACQANAQQWTLIATAIRIANAQGISKHLDKKQWSLDLELRRRVWCCIGILDMQSAFDRGSQPLLRSHELGIPPSDMNDDEDIVEAGNAAMKRSSNHRFTEMSFTLIAYRGTVCQRRLTELGMQATVKSDATASSNHHEEQTKVLSKFEDYVNQLASLLGPGSTPLQTFTVAVGKESLVAMRLLLRRPLHQGGIHRASHESMDILGTATEVLERSQMKRTWSDYSKWAWYLWVKWYALAVVLAELLTARGPAADRGWEAAKWAYEDYTHIVADAKTGLLWRPIAKLMQKVAARREELSTIELPTLGTEAGTGSQDVHMNGSSRMPPTLVSQPEAEDHTASPEDNHEASTGQYDEMESMSWFQWDRFIEDMERDPLYQGMQSFESIEELFPDR